MNKKPINVDYSALTEKVETSSKASNLKVNLLTKYKNILHVENWSGEIFVIDFVFKTNLWTCKIKGLNREKIIGSFCKKELLLNIL